MGKYLVLLLLILFSCTSFAASCEMTIVGKISGNNLVINESTNNESNFEIVGTEKDIKLSKLDKLLIEVKVQKISKDCSINACQIKLMKIRKIRYLASSSSIYHNLPNCQ